MIKNEDGDVEVAGIVYNVVETRIPAIGVSIDFLVCTKCGCAVMNCDQHAKWHEEKN